MELNVGRASSAHAELTFTEILGEDAGGPVPVSRQRKIVPVILSGGGGTRLWPLSTRETPKQFLSLTGSTTLFADALDRVRDRSTFAAPIVVTSTNYGDLCQTQLSDADDAARLVLEPCPRNTAPAILMAAAVAQKVHGDGALILVMPSDHVIEDVDAFHQAVEIARVAANSGLLVTFGVRPTSAETGYGYIQVGDEIADVPGSNRVARFVEKPPLDVARAMVASGDHLWNAGIFLFPVEALLEEASAACPSIAEAAHKAIESAKGDGIRIVADPDVLEASSAESIDYAILEVSSRVAVVPMAPGWSDVGSWDAVATIIGSNEPSGPVTAVDCNDCYIRSDEIEVAALGLEDLIVVASGKRVLILPRGRSQDVKRLLAAMDLRVA